MFTPEFRRVVKPSNIQYAEIYWAAGELGAPCLVWWDLATCKLRLKQWTGTIAEPVLVEAIKALESI